MYMDVRVYLNRKFDKSNPEDVDQVEKLKITFEKSNDTQQKFVICHVLWHVILNCGWPREEIFHQKYLSLLHFISSPSDDSNFNTDFDDLAFLNGFANVYILSDSKFANFSPKNGDEIFANLLHFTLKSSFKRKPIDFYWYFHVIDNLLKKYQKRGQKMEKFFAEKCDFCGKIQNLKFLILKLTQANWDNKFPRVSELGVEIFKNFFASFGRSILKIKIDEMIIGYLNFYPFYVRGKFRMIAKLVEMANLEEHFPTKIAETDMKTENFLNFLLQFVKFERYLCDSSNLPASSNHLAPFVGTVYKTVLHFISKNLSQIGPQIVDRWLKIVVENLCDKNNQLRYNTMKHFVPAVVKYLPQFYESNLMAKIRRLHENWSISVFDSENYLLEINARSLCSLVPFSEPKIDGLKNGDQNLNIELVIWAYALLLKHSANVKEFKLTKEDRKFLEKALIMRDDSTRMEAFDYSTDFSNDGNENRIFIRYEKCLKFLGENSLVSDPSFRRRLVRLFSKYLDYCLQKTSKNCEKRIFCMEFVHKCLDHCWDNLFPEANYQRMSSSLNILEAIIQNVTNYSVSEEILPNFERHFQILIRGLQNSSGDIRESCGRILIRISQNRLLNIDQSTSQSKLIEIATNLSNSPKELDCQSGAALWNLIFRKNIGNFDLESIFTNLKAKFEKLKRNVLLASSENPLHGFLTAAKIYLLQANSFCVEFNLAQNFVEFCARVTDFFNRMLGSSTEGECPSLEQMDVSLAKISLSNDFEDGNIDESDLNNDRQLVLACCWLNIKHSAFLLSTIARSKIKFQNLDVLRQFYGNLGDTFFEMMTRTRHWGVLEGCSEAFGDFCKLCSHHDDPKVKQIPLDILSKVCDHVAKPKSVSITRRAVGFPMMIQCIAVNSNSNDQREILSIIFDRLLNIAERSIENCKMNDLSDIPLVRAMHCLRLLVRNSQLGLDVLQYLSPIYRLVLQHISSGVWPVRNAAMLLLSALIWRLFGRLGIQMAIGENDDDGAEGAATILDDNTFTMSEFRFLFDDILQNCRIYLQTFLEGNFREKDTTNSNFVIFAIFSVLKNICMTKDDWEFCDGEGDRHQIEEMVRNVKSVGLKSRDYRLKRLANDILCKFYFENEKSRQFPPNFKPITSEINQKDIEFHSPARYFDNFWEKMKLEKIDVEDFLSFFNVVYKNPASFFCWSEMRNAADDIFWDQILKCCSKKYGLSVQCLALPIFAAFLERTVENDENHFFRKWAKIVDECAADTRSETCRMAAAHCLVICRKFWVENSYLIDAGIRCRLVLDAVNLFLDEDADIRSIICQISCRNESSTPLNFVLCLENLVSELNTDEFIADQIFRLYFNPNFDDFRTNEDRNSQRKKFLFQQSDFNIFKENFYVQSLFYHFLKSYLKSCSVIDRKTFFSRYSNLQTLLNLADRILTSSIVERNFDAEFYARMHNSATKVCAILDLKFKLEEIENVEDSDRVNNFLLFCGEKLRICSL